MTLIVCTMPQCRTSAGCICERQLRPVRTTKARSPTPIELLELADIIHGESGDDRPLHLERVVWEFVANAITGSGK